VSVTIQKSGWQEQDCVDWTQVLNAPAKTQRTRTTPIFAVVRKATAHETIFALFVQSIYAFTIMTSGNKTASDAMMVLMPLASTGVAPLQRSSWHWQFVDLTDSTAVK
jgi:hypothetical protein